MLKELLIIEEHELDEKIIKLRDYTLTENFKQLSQEEQTTVYDQLRAMMRYSILLHKRIVLMANKETF